MSRRWESAMSDSSVVRTNPISVIAEVYPALYKRRFPKGDRTPDEHDAWSIAAWLQEVDRRGALNQYLAPPLTLSEQKQAELEGWILGVW